MNIKKIFIGAVLGLAVQLSMQTVAFAVDGDVAGPGEPNKTIKNDVEQTFGYGAANSGFGNFTMGHGDSVLTAKWDQIYYRIIFDGTYKIGSPTITKSAKPGEADTYIHQDIVNYSKKVSTAAGKPGTPITDSDQTTITEYKQVPYNLRYDTKYNLPVNDTFSKNGYVLVGWQTRMPASEAEMEDMANGRNGFQIVNSFDGTGKPLQQAFMDNFHTVKQRVPMLDNEGNQIYDQEGNPLYIEEEVVQPIQNSINFTNNVQQTDKMIIKDGGSVKNMTYGGYKENEILTGQYKTVTLYAIWKQVKFSGKVYYSLQKADGSYEYNPQNQTLNIPANKQYIEINNIKDFNSANQYNWLTGGEVWNNRTIQQISRVYRYTADPNGLHDSIDIPVDISKTIPTNVGGGYSGIKDLGTLALDYNTGNIYLKIPRKQVTLNVFGLMQKNNNKPYYVKDKLMYDDGKLFGQFSVNQSFANAWVYKVGQTAQQQQLFRGTKVGNLYGIQITTLVGNEIQIQDIAAAIDPNYTYTFKGYTVGEGTYSLNETNQNPAVTGKNSVNITVNKNSYLLLYFDKSDKDVPPLAVKWGPMTRQYNDPYALGTGGSLYSVQNVTGPWSVVTWPEAKVGQSSQTSKVYYMQVWLDNYVSSQRDKANDDRDRLYIAQMPAGAQLEFRRYVDMNTNYGYVKKDLVIMRFPNGITEQALETWIRTKFAVVQYSDPGDSIDTRLNMYLSNNAYTFANDTGYPTGTVDAQYIGINKGFIPQDSDVRSKAYLVYDKTGIYWKYKYEEKGTYKEYLGRTLDAGDRGGHSYSHDKWDYDYASCQMSLPSWIRNKQGLVTNKTGGKRAGAKFYSYGTQDNGIRGEAAGQQITGWGMKFVNDYYEWRDEISLDGHPWNVEFELWAGDCQTAGTGEIWGEDHGGSMSDMWVEWQYFCLIDKKSYIGIRQGNATAEYTIPIQYPIIIRYNGQLAWTLDSNKKSDVYWENIPGNNSNSFNPNWIYGSYQTSNNHNPSRQSGIPTNYKKDLQSNILQRYGYVWDGRWYILYDQSKVQKTQYDWLQNRLNNAEGQSTYNAQNNKQSLLKYNTVYDSIKNTKASGYTMQRYGAYNNLTLRDTEVSKQFNQGFVPFTNTNKSGGGNVTLDYPQMILLWLQSGAQYQNVSYSDTYTGGTRNIKCRVIDLYAGRTVPIQYTVKFASGASDQWNGQKVPYTWNTGDYKSLAVINNTNSATQAYQSVAKQHALSQAAQGSDTTYGDWYRQQFVYDTPAKFNKTTFQRPNNGLTVDGQQLAGYQFVGWTTYKDTNGNNDNASYRKNDTKNQARQQIDTIIKRQTTNTPASFTSGKSGQIVTATSGSNKWSTKLKYNIGETNEFFLADAQSISNLLSTVTKSGDNTGKVNVDGQGMVQIPNVVYEDGFKWPEVVLYPNWVKQVELQIDIDPSTQNGGKIDGITKNDITSAIYGKDIMYNNQFYYPISLDKTIYHNTGKQVTQWQGKPVDNVNAQIGDYNSWYEQNGLNSMWNKEEVQIVKDYKGHPINTKYRFLGLQFDNLATFPQSQQGTKLPVGSGTIGVTKHDKAHEMSGTTVKNYTHPRAYELQVYDSIKNKPETYQSVIANFYKDPDNNSRYVGQDELTSYRSTIDCYNTTKLYGVWEPELTIQTDITRSGYTTIQVGNKEDRVNSIYPVKVTARNTKAGTGIQTMTAIDGIRPTATADQKKLWEKQSSYQTYLIYRYNDNYEEEIINLYRPPIVNDPKFKQVLDTLNNIATFTVNQRDGKTPNTPLLKTPHTYQQWQYYLPLYLGTDEMRYASDGKWIYSPSKEYETTLVTQRYSYYYANYVASDDKDDEFPDNETQKIYIAITLGVGQDPTNPYPIPTPDPNNPNPTPKPPTDNPDGDLDSGQVLDDLRVHVQLH